MEYLHFSYDTIDCKRDFNDDHDEARRYLICLLLGITETTNIEAFCESTFLVTLDIVFDVQKKNKIFDYLSKNMTPYFHFLISFTKIYTNNNPILIHNVDTDLYNNFQNKLDNISCDNLEKKIKYNY